MVPDPTTQPPIQPPPAEPTTPAFTAVPGVKVAASDITLPASYWDGTGNTGDLVIAVGDTGNIDEDVTGSFTLPAGVHSIGIQVTSRCAVHGTTGFSCSLHPHSVGHVTVDNNAWRRLLTGGVSVSGSGASNTNTFSVYSRPAPDARHRPDRHHDDPEPGERPEERRHHPGRQGDQHRRHLPAGALEVQTPPGVDLVTFPALCKTHTGTDADKDRYELGIVPAGKTVTLFLGLAVTPQARAQAPLTGAVHGFLTPSGQDTIEVLTNYQITAPLAPGETALPTAEPSTDLLYDSGAPEQARAPRGGPSSSRQLPILPIAGGILLVIVVVGVLVFLSLRDRMHDTQTPEPSDEPE